MMTRILYSVRILSGVVPSHRPCTRALTLVVRKKRVLVAPQEATLAPPSSLLLHCLTLLTLTSLCLPRHTLRLTRMIWTAAGHMIWTAACHTVWTAIMNRTTGWTLLVRMEDRRRMVTIGTTTGMALTMSTRTTGVTPFPGSTPPGRLPAKGMTTITRTTICPLYPDSRWRATRTSIT
uniref:Uncharacterized protein n=1 Tax=Cacopsylla melanoneura TaxID=428564 RepID=A0A8D9F6H2_9HEMI